jgi:SAM-dependent methyltransferase
MLRFFRKSKRPDERAILENAHRRHGPRQDRVLAHFLRHLRNSGPTEGRLVEIGGRKNPINGRVGLERFEYVPFDLQKTGPDVVVADITGCPEIPDGYADVVFSMDVFEHIDRPWLAASEITRILKPGGIAYTTTLFSWRYHPCPIDYWRFTPDCLSFLFDGLDTLEAGFDDTERRRDVRGRDRNALKVDAFGGWRENWRVFHVGRKPPA